MKLKNLLPVAMLLLLFSSCTTSRSVVSHCDAQPQKLNIANINGVYQGKALWNKFHASRTTKNDTTTLGDNVQTKIYFDGKKYITATVYENGVSKNELTLKAKVYKDYVSIKKRHKLLPFPPLYFYSDVHKFVLYNDAENNLGLCGYGSITMFVLVMSGGKGGYHSGIYKRTNNTN